MIEVMSTVNAEAESRGFRCHACNKRWRKPREFNQHGVAFHGVLFCASTSKLVDGLYTTAGRVYDEVGSFGKENETYLTEIRFKYKSKQIMDKLVRKHSRWHQLGGNTRRFYHGADLASEAEGATANVTAEEYDAAELAALENVVLGSGKVSTVVKVSRTFIPSPPRETDTLTPPDVNITLPGSSPCDLVDELVVDASDPGDSQRKSEFTIPRGKRSRQGLMKVTSYINNKAAYFPPLTSTETTPPLPSPVHRKRKQTRVSSLDRRIADILMEQGADPSLVATSVATLMRATSTTSAPVCFTRTVSSLPPLRPIPSPGLSSTPHSATRKNI